jgi:hypothetical protein
MSAFQFEGDDHWRASTSTTLPLPGIVVWVREVSEAEYRVCAEAALRLYAQADGNSRSRDVVKFQA